VAGAHDRRHPVDSIFSPVRRVSYEVEAARVGQRTDYDKLTLDVTTDGSLAPRDAIGQGAEILIRQLAIFTDLERSRASARPSGGEAGRRVAAGARDGELPDRGARARRASYNCLKRVGIETIGDLVTKTESELAAIPNFGKKSIEEVRETLQAHGLTLRDE
jgi:DNA-directed RNA polymerase subunit alpha